MYRISIYLVSLLFLVQCTVQKRHFNNGYHVEWRKSVHHSDNNSDNKLENSEDKTSESSTSSSESVVVDSTFLTIQTEELTNAEINDSPSLKEESTIQENKEEPETICSLNLTSLSLSVDSRIPFDSCLSLSQSTTIFEGVEDLIENPSTPSMICLILLSCSIVAIVILTYVM